MMRAATSDDSADPFRAVVLSVCMPMVAPIVARAGDCVVWYRCGYVAAVRRAGTRWQHAHAADGATSEALDALLTAGVLAPFSAEDVAVLDSAVWQAYTAPYSA